MKISFGLCTYNRRELLIKSAKSLYLIENLEDININIYDDCSTEYDVDFIGSIFPTANKIVRRSQNLGADENTALMYQDFLESEDEWIFTADSDLIYRKDILSIMNKYSCNTNGFLSLFNCMTHEDLKEYGDFVEKKSIGAAGCLIRRDVVEIILQEIKNKKIFFDVSFARVLRKHNISVYALKMSAVQHIGIYGYNSKNIAFDYGKNFICDSDLNSKIIEETFEDYVNSVVIFRKSYKWKIYYFISSIPRRILIILKGRK